MRSLTRQVMHQAAVKFTNTGLPCARSSATRRGLQPSAAGPPAVAAAAGGADLGAEDARGLSASAATTPVTAATEPARRQRGRASRVRPCSHAAKAMSRSPPSAAATASGPACRLSTQTSQAAVA